MDTDFKIKEMINTPQMKQQKYAPYLWLILLLMIASCAKESINPEEAIIQPTNGMDLRKAEASFTNQTFYSAKFEEQMLSFSENELVFPASTIFLDSISVGTILPFDISELTPQGALKKVISKEIRNGFLYVAVEDASLEEIFKSVKIDFKHHSYEESPVIRSIQYNVDVMDAITLSFSGNPTELFTINPSIGYNRTLVFDMDCDFEKKQFNHLHMGVENFSLYSEIAAKYNGKISGEASLKEADKFSIKLPAIRFLVQGIPIMINSRLVPDPNVTVDVNGLMEFTAKAGFIKPITAILEIDPKLPSGYRLNCGQNPCQAPDFDFDFDATNIDGGASVAFTFGWALEITLYNQYDLITTFISFGIPKVSFGSSLDVIDQRTGLIIEGNASMPIEIGATTNVLEEQFNLELSNFNKIEWETFETKLFKDTFYLPCGVNLNISRSPEVICIPGNDDLVNLKMRINSPNGDPNGFRISIDGSEIGQGQYGTLVDFDFPSIKMRPSSTLTIVDLGAPTCRLAFTLINPCDQIGFCEGEPITDASGQEYCTMTMADGRMWMNRNLQVTGGFCHNQDPNRCFEIGAFYEFSVIESGGQNGLCPSGYHIPSRAEWAIMMDAESKKSSGSKKVFELFAPNLPNFGNVDRGITNGFNIIPAGYYQGWKRELPINERFTNGILDNSPAESAYFWTSDATFSTSDLPGGGAYAMRIYSSGQWGFVPVSKLAGLTCRCIKN